MAERILAGEGDYQPQPGLFQLWSTPEESYSRGSPVAGLRLTLQNTRSCRALEGLSNQLSLSWLAACLSQRHRKDGTLIPRVVGR